MPEDAHPQLPKESSDNYHYLTLPMALNYQRNSYSLWHSATSTYEDVETRSVFSPRAVSEMDDEQLRAYLTRYKVALQPQRHVQTWRVLCQTFCDLFDGDVRVLFRDLDNDGPRILDFLQNTHKARFPYLSGPKICNYWLFVMDQYTDMTLNNRGKLSVAPDTHVIQATIKLGLVSPELREHPKLQALVSKSWEDVLMGSELDPIDVHTPLWLWSRSGFVPIEH